jgi:predicted permease
MNFRYAFRQLRKNPGFTLTAVLTLAIGIGATTAIFSLVYAVLLRPLPFPQAERLVSLRQQDHSLPGVAAEALSYPDYFDWRAQNHTFSGLASYSGGGVTIQYNGESQRLDALMVSSNFFQVLGAAPMLGRDFRWEDEKADNRTLMLSYALWQSAFGSSKAIVGHSITLGDHSYTIAGVMPEGFRFPFGGKGPALWLSIANAAAGKSPDTSQRGNDQLDVIGRMKPGVTLQQAKADLDVIAAGIARRYPDTNKWYTSVLASTLLDRMVGDTRPALRVLFGAVALVLLLACANVAGLLLARGSQRSAEFALRSAVGASRAEIIRQLLVESVTLSFCGGIAGVVLAGLLLKGIVRLVPLDIPRIDQVAVNGTVLAFAVAVSVLTGLLFGMLPAWQTSRVAPSQALREGGRSLSAGRWQHRLHSSLVIAQTAIGLVLLVGSGLMIRSFVRVLHVDPGFDPKHVFTARVRVSFDHYNHDQHFQFYERLLPKLAALPGVQAASAGWPLPLSDSHASISFSIAGRPVAPGDRPSETIAVVMPGYFETLRIPLLSGRTFTEQDGLQGSPAAIVNQAFAKKYFPNVNPIGQHIQPGLGDESKFDHSLREIVGVVENIKREGLTADVDPEYYLPLAQALISDPYLTIRTNRDPASIEHELRAAVHEMDKGVPVYQVSTLEDYVSQSEAQPRFQTLLLTCFAGIALLLSAIGLYGVLSYIVTQRTFEIGLRMALGAQRSGVLQMILNRGLRLAGIGLAIGLCASALLTGFLRHMLYGVTPLDPITFAAVGLILLAVSALASFAPAWRASQLDPMKTLRDQ